MDVGMLNVLLGFGLLVTGIYALFITREQLKATRGQLATAEKEVEAAHKQLDYAEHELETARAGQQTQERNLALSGYSAAVEGLLGLKQAFMDHAPVFEQQMLQDPANRRHVPPGMDAETFLLFAGGMWRVSYVFSVWKRGEALGLTAGECAGLKAEMLLWLQGIPGFYAVYRAHTSELKAHNPDFLTFLEVDVYNEKFHEAHQVPTAA